MPMTFDELVDELVIQWINGNKGHVYQTIRLQSQPKSIVLAAKVTAKLNTRENRDNFANLLQIRCEDECGVCSFS